MRRPIAAFDRPAFCLTLRARPWFALQARIFAEKEVFLTRKEAMGGGLSKLSSLSFYSVLRYAPSFGE